MKSLPTSVVPPQATISRRQLLQCGGLGFAALLNGLSLPSALDSSDAFAAESDKSRTHLQKLIAGAKKEGHINSFGLDPAWVDYTDIIHRFQSKYGVSLNVESPTAIGAEIIQAVSSLKGQDREPDMVEVSVPFAQMGKAEGLFSPYKVASWRTVPTTMKDAHGYWAGSYWGAISFLALKSVVKRPPQEWHDLRRPEYKGMIAMSGDPRTSGQSLIAVMGASLANGGSLDDIAPGIEFFAQLKKIGNFIAVGANAANIEKGATPIALRFDFLNLVVRDGLEGRGGAVVNIPKKGVVGSYYCQAVDRSAPHPMGARLWQEFIFSDEGQLLFLKGYAHPARYKDLLRRHKVASSLAKRLPAPHFYRNLKFPSVAQIAKASTVLQQQWGPKVAGS
jgi:putative spermidine/putrescine transport system substrate-binding protein